ncbi:MAG: tRNA glutamyl-Q(34) synthetase GluQRS, partial [Burkholderiales bacterium]
MSPDVPRSTLPFYRGRFAPSPTGPLHFGSLVAAAASYLDARAASGQWLVRIEDLDPPRELRGAGAQILASLEAFGLEWDGPVLHQSTRHEAYRTALESLSERGAVYDCGCTRREIADSNPRWVAGTELVYPGTCAGGLARGRVARATRVRVDPTPITFDDALRGRIEQDLTATIGDFVLKRADGPYAYQLAVVVDDAFQGITDIVRGADLLHSTPRQIHLQRLLGLATPRYMHIPVVLDAAGEKLSKQTLAQPIDPTRPGHTLRRVFEFLGLHPPA